MKTKLQELIKSKGKKQVEVANLLGMKKQNFRSKCLWFEKGKKNFTYEQLKKMSEFLNCEIDDFF